MKRVLICDDDQLQFEILENTLKDRYDIRRSTDYRSVVADLEKLAPVHLLILDLGFPEGQYVGQECLPEVLRRYPSLKVIVRSDILTRHDRREQSLNIARDLVAFPQVVGFLSSADLAPRIEFEVDKALGTPRWLRSGEVWILHVSDLQFGGRGLPDKPYPLANKITQTIESFVQDTEANETLGERKLPFLAAVTGDITERARPFEFEDAGVFMSHLSAFMLDRRPDMAGVMGKTNVLVVPGNHDVSWDILRGQNLAFDEGSATKTLQYRDGKSGVQSELGFLHRVAWLPFVEANTLLAPEDREWAWDPGYRIVNLKNELGIVIALVNSSRWGITHIEQWPYVPQETWIDIGQLMSKADSNGTAARILMIHHTLTESVSVENRLALRPQMDDSSELIDALSRVCRFSVVFTGHIHRLSARELDTTSSQAKLIHIGAGTARSADRPEYRNPQFNLVKLGDLSPETNKFGSLTIYPFQWDGARFSKQAAFEYGMSWWKRFDLRY
jgi:CheY-like chemotaxis protein